MIDAARRASAQRITAVLPFYGYARQDRKDQPRVPITAKLVANLLVSAGANRILTMDLHSQQIQGFFDIPVDHLYASPVFFEYLAASRSDNLVVCSPDVGGMKMAAAYADVLGAGLGLVAKKRTERDQRRGDQRRRRGRGQRRAPGGRHHRDRRHPHRRGQDPARPRGPQRPGGGQPLRLERGRLRAAAQRA